MTHVVLALPRSRTAWLSRFLTYRDWTCGHEELPNMRSLGDVAAYLGKPRHGTAETAAMSGWRLLADLAPDAKIVLVRRPVREVVDSLIAIRGIRFDRPALAKIIEAGDRKLDQIEARLPCRSVRFADLAHESTCKAIFEYCLPYQHDHAHWRRLDHTNVQIDVPALFERMGVSRGAFGNFVSAARRRMLDTLAAQSINKRELVWQR